MNKWEKIKRYINSKKIGTVIYRKNLMHHIFHGPHPPTSSYGTTVDNYRRSLTKLGILEHTDLGEYTIRYHIREDLTSTELKAMAYGGFRSWFNDAKVPKGEQQCLIL